MSVDDSGDQPSADEIDPFVGVRFSAGQAEGRLACHGDGVERSTSQTAKSDEAHFLRVTAIEHLIDDLIMVRGIVARVGVFEV